MSLFPAEIVPLFNFFEAAITSHTGSTVWLNSGWLCNAISELCYSVLVYRGQDPSSNHVLTHTQIESDGFKPVIESLSWSSSMPYMPISCSHILAIVPKRLNVTKAIMYIEGMLIEEFDRAHSLLSSNKRLSDKLTVLSFESRTSEGNWRFVEVLIHLC